MICNIKNVSFVAVEHRKMWRLQHRKMLRLHLCVPLALCTMGLRKYVLKWDGIYYPESSENNY